MNKNNSSSIFDAIDQKNVKVLQQILDKNSNLLVYDPNSYEDTPLHKAIRTKQILLVELLLKYNAPLEARNKFNDTPLHLAVATADKDVVAILLDAGADTEAINSNNKKPIDIAKDYKLNEIMELLSLRQKV